MTEVINNALKEIDAQLGKILISAGAIKNREQKLSQSSEVVLELTERAAEISSQTAALSHSVSLLLADYKSGHDEFKAELLGNVNNQLMLSRTSATKQLTELGTSVDAFASGLSAHAVQINDQSTAQISAFISSFEIKLTEFNSANDQLLAAVDNFRSTTDNFNQQSEKILPAIDKLSFVDGFQEQLVNISADFRQVQSKIDKLDSFANTTASKIKAISGGLDDQRVQIAALLQQLDQTAQKTQLADVEKKLSTKVDQLHSNSQFQLGILIAGILLLFIVTLITSK